MKQEMKKNERNVAMNRRSVLQRICQVKEYVKAFWKEEDGMGSVEVALIIVVLVALVIIFKGKITNIINSILNKIQTQAGTV